MKKFLIMLLAYTLMGVFHYNWFTPPSLPTTTLPKGEIPILTYHKVNPSMITGGLGLRVPPSDFDKQMKYLSDHSYHTIGFDQLTDFLNNGQPLPDNPVIITFDDGYLDNYTYAFPILKKYNFTATVFLVSDLIGRTNRWDEIIGYPTNTLMDWPQIKEMQQYGITFGSHTVHHPHLAQIPLEQARWELTHSKKYLEEKLGQPVNYFCYPYGNYNPAVVKLVHEAGYKTAVTLKQGRVDKTADPIQLKRVRVTGHYNLGKFIEKLTKNYLTEKKPYSL